MSGATAKLDNSLSDAENLLDQIRNDMSRLDSLGFEQRRALDSEIDRKMTQLETLLNRMTTDLRGVTQQSSKSYYEGEIKNFRTEHSKAVEELRQKRLAAANDPRLRQEQQLMSNADRSKGINDTLDETIRVANDTLTIGNSAMAVLHDDRQHLQHVDQNLDKIHMQAEQGQRTAKDMLRRACLNGVISWIIVILLLAIFIFSLWYTLTHDKNGGSKE